MYFLQPTEKILAICEEMQTSQVNNKAFTTALETSLQQGNIPVAISLMEKIKESGAPIRQHYFWPLFAAQRNSKNTEGVCQVLVEMQKMGIILRGETIRDYVLDSLKGSTLEKLQTLRACGISLGTASVAMTIDLLEKCKLDEAAEFGNYNSL